MHEKLMRRAIEMAAKGIAAGQSPFGAVVATNKGDVIFEAHNMVRGDCDATAHAEILAIRGACDKLSAIDLTGHVIAATCEPCPMCAAAIHWARLDAVIYGAGIADAGRAGFNELSISTESIYGRGASHVRVHPCVSSKECVALFETWRRGPNPNPY